MFKQDSSTNHDNITQGEDLKLCKCWFLYHFFKSSRFHVCSTTPMHSKLVLNSLDRRPDGKKWFIYWALYEIEIISHCIVGFEVFLIAVLVEWLNRIFSYSLKLSDQISIFIFIFTQIFWKFLITFYNERQNICHSIYFVNMNLRVIIYDLSIKGHHMDYWKFGIFTPKIIKRKFMVLTDICR